MNVALSLGGIVVALAILWANLRPWWTEGKRDPKALLPYGSGAILGALATICVGGALGWGASGIAGLSTRAGDKAVTSTTGTGSAPLETARMGVLTPAGGAVVCLILVGVILLYRASGKKDRRRILGGLVTFAILGFLPGVAAALSWLPDSINTLGAHAVAALNSGKGLL